MPPAAPLEWAFKLWAEPQRAARPHFSSSKSQALSSKVPLPRSVCPGSIALPKPSLRAGPFGGLGRLDVRPRIFLRRLSTFWGPPPVIGVPYRRRAPKAPEGRGRPRLGGLHPRGKIAKRRGVLQSSGVLGTPRRSTNTPWPRMERHPDQGLGPFVTRADEPSALPWDRLRCTKDGGDKPF